MNFEMNFFSCLLISCRFYIEIGHLKVFLFISIHLKFLNMTWHCVQLHMRLGDSSLIFIQSNKHTEHFPCMENLLPVADTYSIVKQTVIKQKMPLRVWISKDNFSNKTIETSPLVKCCHIIVL